MLLRHSFIIIYIRGIHSNGSITLAHIHVYIYKWRNSLYSPCSPCKLPFASPFVSLSTYLAPSRCDRNRPPPSQVACKLTPFAPLHPVDPFPPQLPRTPPAPRLTTTTSGIFWLLRTRTGRGASFTCLKMKN